ncbi:quinol:cytochrome C oxidoreductase [Arachidicoccus ginsenosidimutans]|uniref:DUF3341 domain-containing protein n=1 Tax=Arachidicoccus sp. BS20 TaxID=1850526 RepID=UPI0007F169AE|nr:DUF3341 domain-containing protein [Arachidicoccus sp. BS20]ANI90220.1 quinol:cytochrome C oxidoreductase [Arachidicoccus sp. BS20]
MAKKKFVVASFDDEEKVFPAVKDVRTAGYKIHDVYTPFPVHGLDHALGLRETSLHTAGFIYGITGTATALGCMTWIFTSDWPQIYDGKPHFALPAFVPITFELTVLFAAVGMVMTFCWLCQLAPFVKKHIFNPRQTDDLFIMAIECTSSTNVDELVSFMKSKNVVDVEIQEAEADWWWGRFDKEQQIINEQAVEVL